MQLLWIDLETGGLDPKQHDILEVCFIETDREGVPVTSFVRKVKPTRPVLPEAAKVNGYTEEKWQAALPIERVREELNHIFSGKAFIPAGWNIQFDLSFMWEQLRPERFKLYHHAFDLMAHGWNEIADLVEKPHLRDLCVRLGIPVQDEHTAAGDVGLMLGCYRELRHRRRVPTTQTMAT